MPPPRKGRCGSENLPFTPIPSNVFAKSQLKSWFFLLKLPVPHQLFSILWSFFDFFSHQIAKCVYKIGHFFIFWFFLTCIISAVCIFLIQNSPITRIFCVSQRKIWYLDPSEGGGGAFWIMRRGQVE